MNTASLSSKPPRLELLVAPSMISLLVLAHERPLLTDSILGIFAIMSDSAGGLPNSHRDWSKPATHAISWILPEHHQALREHDRPQDLFEFEASPGIGRVDYFAAIERAFIGEIPRPGRFGDAPRNSIQQRRSGKGNDRASAWFYRAKVRRDGFTGSR